MIVSIKELINGKSSEKIIHTEEKFNYPSVIIELTDGRRFAVGETQTGDLEVRIIDFSKLNIRPIASNVIEVTTNG